MKNKNIIGQYRARQAHEISMPMQITGFGGRTFERVEYRNTLYCEYSNIIKTFKKLF
jgi:hypothetical protein